MTEQFQPTIPLVRAEEAKRLFIKDCEEKGSRHDNEDLEWLWSEFADHAALFLTYNSPITEPGFNFTIPTSFDPQMYHSAHPKIHSCYKFAYEPEINCFKVTWLLVNNYDPDDCLPSPIESQQGLMPISEVLEYLSGLPKPMRYYICIPNSGWNHHPL